MRVPLDAAVVRQHARRSGCRGSDRRTPRRCTRAAAAGSTRAACKGRWCDRSGRPPARSRAIAVSRGARAGCRSGWARSCARMSGEALTSAQAAHRAPRTAMEDWVRARARSGALAHARAVAAVAVPLGKAAAGGRPQDADFHVRARTVPGRRMRQPLEHALARFAESAIGDVHRDFHAEAEVDRLRSFPAHESAPYVVYREVGPHGPASILAKRARRAKGGSS